MDLQKHSIAFLREQLTRRFDAISQSPDNTYHWAMCRFWNFVTEQPVFAAAVASLVTQFPNAVASARNTWHCQTTLLDCTYRNNSEQAAYACVVIDFYYSRQNERREIELGSYALHNKDRRNDSDPSLPLLGKGFTEVFLRPMYIYLLESLDTQVVIHAILLRYKAKCESFIRSRLLAEYGKNTTTGEHSLALHLREYLHDRNIDVFAEPQSSSGRADMVSIGVDCPLIVDAKLFKGSLRYIAEGFQQIYRYAQDFNQPFAILVIYNVCGEELHLGIPQAMSHLHFVEHNGKTLYAMIVDVAERKSASKAGTIKRKELTQEEIITVLREDDAPQLDAPATGN